MLNQKIFELNKVLFIETSPSPIKYALSRLKKCENILEVGCGPGVFYKPWSDLDVQWTGIDINPYWRNT